jgi:predicted GH43/DUF377 family glycosyl hydrolase
MEPIFTHSLRLYADPSRVVVRPFHIGWQGTSSRTERLVREVLQMSPRQASEELEEVLRDFEARHWQTRRVFMTRYDEIEAQLGLDGSKIGDEKRQLIGAYFCHEYSYAAAALMNPSVVPHYDQSGMPKGSCRILMSLRAVGEGHISSIAFREGVAFSDRGFTLWPEPQFALAAMPDPFDAEDGPVTVHRHESAPLSGNVIFPVTNAQRNGLEDLRLVQFEEEDGSRPYYGTYTAYSGREVSCEMLTTERFRSFDLEPMSGAAASHKGLALFPKRINGEFAAIGRLDAESLYYLTSTDRFRWEQGRMIMAPKFPWELVQLGNCGSPVEIDEGWLLLTHGVGAMRQYAIGAALLDKKEPWRVLARSELPFIAPINEAREGYVPNVVYTCGALRVGDSLFIPYAVADSSVKFVTVKTKDLLGGLK